MKRYLVSIVLIVILATSMVQAQEKPIQTYTDAYNKLMQRTQWWGNNEQGNFFVNVNSPTYMTFELPDQHDTVIKIQLK